MTVFEDGKLVKEWTLDEIRARAEVKEVEILKLPTPSSGELADVLS